MGAERMEFCSIICRDGSSNSSKDRRPSSTDTNRGICWFVFYAFLPTKVVTEGKMNVEYVQATMSQLKERSTAGQLVAKLTEPRIKIT